MQMSWVKKAVVYGILVLLIGTGIGSAIGTLSSTGLKTLNRNHRSSSSETSSHPLVDHHTVLGFISYSDGSGVPDGVPVKVTCLETGLSYIRTTSTTIHGQTGLYHFDAYDLDAGDGDTILANVSYGGCEGNNTAMINYSAGIVTVLNATIYGNLPPYPNQPSGPTNVYVNESYNFSVSGSVDPESDPVNYGWDWNGDDIADEWTGYLPSGQSYTMSHTWDVPGTYHVQIRAKDIHGAETGKFWSDPLNVSVHGHPFSPPSQPVGPINGLYNSVLTYTTSATDPDDFPLYYLFNWGDGTADEKTYTIRYDDNEMDDEIILQYTQDTNFAEKSINISKAVLNGSVSAKLWIYGKSSTSGSFRIKINGIHDITFSGSIFNNTFSWRSFDIDTDWLIPWVNTFYLRRRSGDIELHIGIDNDTVEGMSRWQPTYGPIYTNGELMIYLQINSIWFGPYNSDDDFISSHLWSQPGTYDVTAKARDDWNESGWSPALIVDIYSNPPYTPSSPSPANGASNVDIQADLSWTGGDPDSGDIVTYDVYFGVTSPPPKVASNQSSTSYNPGTMNYSTQYYWRVISWDNHGNSTAGPLWHFTTVLDVTPPVTTVSFYGTLGNNGWYTSPVTVTLTATDSQSGVMSTMYKIDSGSWTAYASPFAVSDDSNHTVSYYSVDKVGNVETTKTINLKIDRTKPTLTLTKQEIGLLEIKFTAQASDETSGIARVEFFLDGQLQYNDTQAPYEWTWTGIGNHQVTATAYDLAGNSQSQSMSTPYSFNLCMKSVQFQFLEVLMKQQSLS